MSKRVGHPRCKAALQILLRGRFRTAGVYDVIAMLDDRFADRTLDSVLLNILRD
ncbi:MAG: hypothetical protein ACLTD2_00840 [Ruminococcus sp.]